MVYSLLLLVYDHVCVCVCVCVVPSYMVSVVLPGVEFSLMLY